MNKICRMNLDVNNNYLGEDGNNGAFIERHLVLGEEDDFLIIPNGGTGDCMFKAVSQAVYDGDESRHKEIRNKVVNFIVSKRWDKFAEFIEVQHINGNNLLQRQWAKDPRHTYEMYMNLPGTLGSSSELTAASELFQYNFATVQEYCNENDRSYRVENCIQFDQEYANFHYFYFTGDFDNGHWECLRNLTGMKTEDGMYNGRHRTVIDGEETTIEKWLHRETDNNNSLDLLKILTNRTLFTHRRSIFPFDMKNCFHFDPNGRVRINDTHFSIVDVDFTDLYSVLAHESLKHQGNAHEIELLLIKHRHKYFEEINYKLITQPYSSNFTTEAIKYCSFTTKGNIQDLICAADLFSFSFTLFVKVENTNEECGEDVHQCKFVHVDRWGGENDRMLYFYMRLVPAGIYDGLVAKWWLLEPYTGNWSRPKSRAAEEYTVANASDSSQGTFANLFGKDLPLDRAVTAVKTSRPVTTECRPITRASTARPRSSRSASFMDYEKQDDPYDCYRETLNHQDSRPTTAYSDMCTSADEAIDIQYKDSFQRDFENIFGDSMELGYQESPRLSDARLMQKPIRTDRFKPATGMDLLKHPEKVKTIVRVTDKSNAGRHLTYHGSGYMGPDAVLSDLQSQGLIKSASSIMSPSYKGSKKFSFDKIFRRSQKRYGSTNFLGRENFNYFAPKQNEVSASNNFIQSVESGLMSDPQALYNQQLFSQAVLKCMHASQMNIKRNKIIPNSNDLRAPPGRNSEELHPNRPCLTGLARVVARMTATIKRMSAAVRNGLRNRYERYQSSPSTFTSPPVKHVQQEEYNFQFPNSDSRPVAHFNNYKYY